MALLRRSIDQFDDLNHRSLAFDAELMADLARVGGMNYANLSALAYRQCVAGNKVAADSRGQPLMFPKENSSSGLASTVDVIYPSSPQFLLLSPSLTKAMLIPVLGYASSYRWPWSFAPHDLGRYPIVGGQSYGGGEHSEQTQMPIEETANCLLLLGALAQAEGNASFADPYWPLIQKWAGYLRQKGFDPEEQICSDDFKGPLAHNANLSVKAICALGAFAQLCQFRGDATSATEWREAAKNFARRWIEAASDGDHFRLAFDRPGTWSQKYNLVWDRLLGLDLFPDSVRRQEMDFYKTRQNRYGLPLDGRDSFTKADWTLWSATLTGNRQDFDALFAPLYRFFSETTNRVPLADWCLTEAPLPRSFRARPVVGAFFLPLLYDRPIWKKWAARDATHAKDWAPILPPPRVLTIMPTADEEALSWHFSLNAPPSGWMNPDFNASAWPEGQGGFGTNGLPAAIMRTLWNGPDIWLRREVNLAPLSGHELRFRLYRSAEVQIYLNGVLAKSLPAGPNQYEVVTIRAAARSTIKPGKNVLAVHARPGSSGQFFDLGVVDLAPAD